MANTFFTVYFVKERGRTKEYSKQYRSKKKAVDLAWYLSEKRKVVSTYVDEYDDDMKLIKSEKISGLDKSDMEYKGFSK